LTSVEHLEHHLTDQPTDLFWYRLRWKVVRAHLPEGQFKFQLVDVGAGSGFLGDCLHRDRPAARYGFVEPIGSLNEALTRRYGPGAAFDIEDLHDADVVTLLDVLEHQKDDRKFLKRLVSTVEPGARILLTVPALRLVARRDGRSTAPDR
jgi:2-polyprenyl-3-methyl-5-hydroxy-6-metoxy-1,4-benzoquinol methylase